MLDSVLQIMMNAKISFQLQHSVSAELSSGQFLTSEQEQVVLYRNVKYQCLIFTRHFKDIKGHAHKVLGCFFFSLSGISKSGDNEVCSLALYWITGEVLGNRQSNDELSRIW